MLDRSINNKCSWKNTERVTHFNLEDRWIIRHALQISHTGRIYLSITTFLKCTYLSYNTWAVLSSRGPFDLKISFVDSGDLWAVRKHNISLSHSCLHVQNHCKLVMSRTCLATTRVMLVQVV